MRWESSRLAAIVFGTFVDLIDTLKSSKSSCSISCTYSSAAATSASTGFGALELVQVLGQRARSSRPPGSARSAARALSTTSRVFSWPPMLPGLIRMQWAPASIAFSASVWLKWMSAITGIGDSRTILRSASTSLSRGTAQRTRSAPSSAIAWIWRIVAS